MKCLLSILLVLGLAGPASAETFRVLLGDRQLGTLTYTDGPTRRLDTTLDNTPLNVFNGKFTGSSRPTDASRTFIGISKSTRKSRTVTVQIAEGRASSTLIEPSSEQTELSDPAVVPVGIIDPVSAIGRLLTAQGCPETIRIYDGRRVITLTPTRSKIQDETLTCTIKYTVTDGPGHLSPLRISNATMRLTYAGYSTVQDLRQIALKSGIFGLTLDRAD
ncbi:hypothetical protein C1J03_04115 [Sulfitobacter sp. SK012]|uniref:hypothetical protein n=1 Tax=Sulfitobacter sp. SK012 TaxID=1389005 RepID=UPI000E0B91B0|nr:hypothetical protein [Sulfitobacter sp. SK012]AXI45292.1 hypothetical protein C1J03_04115 [Sulfitobacter sp. SK012]